LFWQAHMRHLLVPLALAVAAAALPTTADARSAPPLVWATVNVCDTQEHPNQMGVRGSMPGLARTSRMYMRFRVQFQNKDQEWRTIKSSPLSDSRWVRVASGRRGVHDAGWSFEFKPPASGGAHVLRGIVRFEWRRGGRVVERARAFTEAGHPGTAGAEPPEFTAATCEIA
jgi:hypothetical protein